MESFSSGEKGGEKSESFFISDIFDLKNINIKDSKRES